MAKEWRREKKRIIISQSCDTRSSGHCEIQILQGQNKEQFSPTPLETGTDFAGTYSKTGTRMLQSLGICLFIKTMDYIPHEKRLLLPSGFGMPYNTEKVLKGFMPFSDCGWRKNPPPAPKINLRDLLLAAVSYISLTVKI
ncbi:hypothetical protein [Acidaminobacterium chupaoyuni]